MTEREELLDLLNRHAVAIPRDFRRLLMSVLRADKARISALETALVAEAAHGCAHTARTLVLFGLERAGQDVTRMDPAFVDDLA